MSRHALRNARLSTSRAVFGTLAAASLVLGASPAQGDASGYVENPYLAQLADHGNWIDVTNWSSDPAKNANPSAGNDDTAALKAAFEHVMDLQDAWDEDEPKTSWTGDNKKATRRMTRVLYFPDGEYRVNQKLEFRNTTVKGNEPQYVRVIGESRDGTILVVPSGSFTSASSPQPVISFYDGGGFANGSFQNSVENLTIDVKSNNAGAVALQWHVNNAGVLRNLKIKAPGTGYTGIWGRYALSGTGYMRNIEIEGFKYGFRLEDEHPDYNLEHVTLRNQLAGGAGIYISERATAIRDLLSINTVPAILAEGSDAHVVLLDSDLRTPDNTGVNGPAIKLNGNALNQNTSNTPQLHAFIRNVNVSGYNVGVNHSDGGNISGTIGKIGQWVYSDSGYSKDNYDGIYARWSDAPVASAVIPGSLVKDMPFYSWQAPSNWATLLLDDANGARVQVNEQELQSLLNSGSKTIVVGGSGGILWDEPVNIPPTVERIHFGYCKIQVNQTAMEAKPLLRILGNRTKPIVIEAIGELNTYGNQPTHIGIENLSNKTVVLRDIGRMGKAQIYRNVGTGSFAGQIGTGETFIEAMAAHNHVNTGDIGEPGFYSKYQTLWARSLNIEGPEGATVEKPNVHIDGGQFWLFGYKVGEGDGVYFDFDNATAEVLGGTINSRSSSVTTGQAMVEITDSAVLVLASQYGRDPSTALPDPVGVRENNGSTTRTIAHSALPRRYDAKKGKYPVIVTYRSRLAGLSEPPPSNALTVEIDGSSQTLTGLASYSGTQDEPGDGDLTLLADGEGVRMTGNTWKRYDLNHELTSNTMLEVTVTLQTPGELIGIGFDTDDSHQNQIGSSYSMVALDNTNQNLPADMIDGTPLYGGGTQTVTIPIGEYYTGTMAYLCLMADDDRNPAQTDVTFDNIRIYEKATSNVSWVEDFALPNGTTQDTGNTAWAIYNGPPANTFSVQNGQFVANNIDVETDWRSDWIDITGGPVTLSLDIDSSGGLDAGEDYLKVFYKIDGNPWQLVEEFDGPGSATAVVASGLTGNAIRVIVRAYNTGSSEVYMFDNVSVTSD